MCVGLHQRDANVAGAGGAIGVAKAVAAAPDGYTLVVGPDSAIAIGYFNEANRFAPIANDLLVAPTANGGFKPNKELNNG